MFSSVIQFFEWELATRRSSACRYDFSFF